MELRTEGRQALIVKDNDSKVGVIQQLNTESLKAYRMVFDVLKYKKGSTFDVVFVDEGQEKVLGTFEVEDKSFACLRNDYFIINEAQLKQV